MFSVKESWYEEFNWYESVFFLRKKKTLSQEKFPFPGKFLWNQGDRSVNQSEQSIYANNIDQILEQKSQEVKGLRGSLPQ